MTDIHTLERLLRKLRLTRIASEWHSQEKRALAEGWTPSRYLLSLCSEEATHRESERLRRYIKDARLPVGKTLAEYDFGQVPELNTAQVRQLCEKTDWVDSGKNVLLFGAGELLEELRKARSLLRLNEVLLKLDRYRVIVIDDLGCVKRDNAETGVLFELIAHRYERGSLIITSNHPFSTWGNIFVDETMAVAAADRLIHHGYIFEVTGESYRKKMSKAAIQQSAKQ
ncbi:ATP-binding protein [Serratia symbiotica]|uniref:ATP-binding protein n=1 Tax=Serratia symbiotica TaxID=138074 RepID=UPI002091AFE0|nr:ATP-binding protein [Serratia symbiotica]USS94957.1 ATP-binding protein [Serratia symbiotica]